MGENNASKWGFWLPVTDEDSANYAAKMSGLPVFLLGFASLVSAFAFLELQGPVFASISFAFGLFLFVSGLRIRGGKYGLLPVAVGVWLINTIWVVSITGLQPASIVSILIGLLAVSGLRGWFWLRRNGQT